MMQERSEKMLTGYPSIDKPWKKYYTKKALDLMPPQETPYQFIWRHNKEHLSDTAFIYYGKKITFGELFTNIELTAKVMYGLGIRESDRVLYLMPNIPETAYFLYGGVRIGAVADYVDPRPESIDCSVSAQKMLTIIKTEKIKHIVSLDLCYLTMLHPIEGELKKLGLEKIIIVSASDSMDGKTKLKYLTDTCIYASFQGLCVKMKRQKAIQEQFLDAKKKSSVSLLMYKELIEQFKDTSFPDFSYTAEHLDVIVHTSGTSGSMPKPIPLTNNNLNGYAYQTFNANMPIERGDRALHVLPYFAAFGLVNIVHGYLAHGVTLIEVPEFEPKDLGKMILKNRIQHFVGTPSWFVSIANDPALKKADLSFLKMMTYGGDSLDVKQERQINLFLNQHGAPALTKGHGMSETCGCAAYAVGEYNRIDSFGIPLPNTIYAVVNPETKDMIPFEEGKDYIEGEFIISSPAVTRGVLDGRTVAFCRDYNGTSYLLTGDLGRMYRDGSMSFLSRNDRTFTRYDGYKIKPYEIETVIKSHKCVKDCVISSYQDSRKHGKMPIAYIIPDHDPENRQAKLKLANAVIHDCFVSNPDVSSRQLPSKIVFLDIIPLTKNGKTDYKTLSERALNGDEISVDFEESTISLGEIVIH